MTIFLLNCLTIFVLSVLGIFSLRRLIFGFTTIFTKPDQPLENTESFQPFVTVLIPCHNEERVIAKTLDAFLHIDYPEEKLEVVAIDDLSTDNTFTIIQDYEEKYSHIHVIKRHKNTTRGKAAALNEALSQFTRGEIVYFLDADHCVQPDTLARLVAHLSNPDIGVVSGRSIPWNRYDSLIASYTYLESLVHNRVTMYSSDRLGLTPAIQGSNFCIRRSLLEKIGLFNEGHLTEDLDMTLTIYEHGYSVKYDITSITEHEVPDSIKSYILQHLRWNRGFNEVAKRSWRQILKNKKFPLFRRIDEVIFSLGYFDRIFFCIAFGLTLLSLLGLTAFHFPYWVWPIFIGLPAMEILTGLFVEKEPLTMYLRLPLILSMFLVDVYVAIKAFYQDLARKPTKWYKTPRTGDRSNIH